MNQDTPQNKLGHWQRLILTLGSLGHGPTLITIGLEDRMAIAKAVEQGGIVRVYDERGNLKFSKAGTLQGHTGTTVSVRQGHTVRTYDDNGNQRFPKAV